MNQQNPLEHEIILNWIEKNATVLDLGCGDGKLLTLLIKEKQVHAQGIELQDKAIHQCITAGLNVIQQDIDTGLSEYTDKTFDYVILNQTLQQVKNPNLALKEALRTGKKVIVGFPNFAHIHARLQILIQGKVPTTHALPYPWYNTPNLHFLSIKDFKNYCKNNNIHIHKTAYTTNRKKIHIAPNLRAETALFLISKQKINHPHPPPQTPNYKLYKNTLSWKSFCLKSYFTKKCGLPASRRQSFMRERKRGVFICVF